MTDTDIVHAHTPNDTPEAKPPSKFWLYLPFAIFGILLTAYTAYWFYVRGKLDTGINDFITQQRDAGADISFASKRVHGFPFRFTLTMEDPQFANAEIGFDWKGEKLQINMQPWNFYHYIARSSGRNEMTVSGENYTALIGPGSALSIDIGKDGLSQAGITLDSADFITAQGDISLQNFKASLLEAGANIPGKRILIDWDTVTVSDDILDLIGEDYAFLGNELQASRLRLSGQGFGIFGETEERKTEIAQLLVNWGPVKLGTKGKFNVNDEGYLDGTLQLRLEDSDTLLRILKEETQLGSEALSFVGTIGLATKNANFFAVPIRNGNITYPGMSAQAFPQIAPARGDQPRAPAQAEE